MSDVFCKMPFLAMEISNDGSITPCCSFTERHLYDDGVELNVNNMTPDQALNGKTFSELRRKMLNNEAVDGCSNCYDIDKAGGFSYRQRYNSEFSHVDIPYPPYNKHTLKSMDIKLSNVCNQACVICNPYASSMVYQEMKKHWPATVVNFQNEKFNWHQKEEIWQYIKDNLSTTEHLDFYGGEPWLIKKHWELLNYIIDNDMAKNIRLNYATNGSLYNQKWIDNVFTKFNGVSILLSADGTKEHFEYCRHPAKWNTFQNTLTKLKQAKKDNKIQWLGIGYTVSAFSIFNLIESLEFYTALDIPVWIHWVNEARQSVAVLPNNIKDQLCESIEKNWNKDFCLVDDIDHRFVTERIQRTTTERDIEKFFEQLQFLDKVKPAKFLDLVPQLETSFNDWSANAN